MKFKRGFLYTLRSLSQEEQDLILSFLNNQHNATQTMHFILLNHIKKHGTGDVNLDVKIAMLQGQQSVNETVQPVEQITPTQQVETTQKSDNVDDVKVRKYSDGNKKDYVRSEAVHSKETNGLNELEKHNDTSDSENDKGGVPVNYKPEGFDPNSF